MRLVGLMLTFKIPEQIGEAAAGIKGVDPSDVAFYYDNYSEEMAYNLCNVLMYISVCFKNPDVKVYSILKDNLKYFVDFFEEYGGRIPELPNKIEEMQVEYVRLFVSNKDGVPASPYASVYIGKDGLLFSDELLVLRKLMADTGFELKEEQKDLEDHISIMLEYMSIMIGRLNVDGITALKGFIYVNYRFVLPMVEKFAAKVRGSTNLTFYETVAKSLENLVKDMDNVLMEVFSYCKFCIYKK